MESLQSLPLIVGATISIGFLHALAPDHWAPFVSIGQAQSWSKTRLIRVTFLSGIGHVGSSVLIGCIGLALGFGLSGLESMESQRAEIAGLLLIGFGLVYAIWGWKHAHSHRHLPIDTRSAVTTWTLIAIFLLGPCEPLIPLMFVSVVHGWDAVVLVALLFGVITLAMMVGQVLLAYVGVRFFVSGRSQNHIHHSHTMAGLVIAGTGLMVTVLGL